MTKAERNQLNDAIKDRKRKGPKSKPTRKKVVRQPLEEVFKALGFTKDGVEIESANENMAEYYDRMQKEEEEKARLAQMSSKEHVSEDEKVCKM